MKKRIALTAVVVLLTAAGGIWAQSPLGSRGYEWNEQDGYAIIDGKNYHYWLYSILYYLEEYPYGKEGKSVDDCLSELIADLQR